MEPLRSRLRQTVQLYKRCALIVHAHFAQELLLFGSPAHPSQLVLADGKVQEVDGPVLVGGARFRATTHSLHFVLSNVSTCNAFNCMLR